ncbi:hypothetical protein RIF29_39534 [Crotalaria pallida]|uniref:Uncharacterized protein n=1 Tax=Crotalaria pallida TaxID=3830 RepID=A0AAN9E1F2_CROPI
MCKNTRASVALTLILHNILPIIPAFFSRSRTTEQLPPLSLSLSLSLSQVSLSTSFSLIRSQIRKSSFLCS